MKMMNSSNGNVNSTSRPESLPLSSSQTHFSNTLGAHFQDGGVHRARGTIVTRTTKSSEKRYHAPLWTEKPDGTKKQVWRTFHLKRDAEAYLAAQSKLVRGSEYIEPSAMTFAQFANEWLEKYRRLSQLKDSTWAAYYNTVQRHLIPGFGSQRLNSIEAAAIEKDFKASLAEGRIPKA